MRVVRGEVTLSVQDLVCDGCRGVSVEGGFVGVVGGVWHFCWLVMWLCGCFGCLAGRWWDDGGGDRLVGLAVWGRWCV